MTLSSSNRNTSGTLGLLLVNLGSPDAPTAEAVKPYLQQFLSDRRVVDLPKWLWQPILRGIILRRRPERSAALYKSIWLPEGPPLLVYSQSLVEQLRAHAQANDLSWQVGLGMTYGNPSMLKALRNMQQQGIEKIVIVPLFPQYSTTTTAAVYDALDAALDALQYTPNVTRINDYYQQDGHIGALVNQVRKQWQVTGVPDHFVMSFHGTPQATRRQGDPYYSQCIATGEALAKALALDTASYTIVFQSRFGLQKWLQPYAEPVIQALATNGAEHIDVMCPGFAVDCLETLEEVEIGFEEVFCQAGGKRFQYIPCLNDNEDQVATMVALVAEAVKQS